jgi:hypothetical protein
LVFTVRKAKYTIWKSSLVHSEESKIYNNMKILLGSQWGKQNFHIIVYFAFLTVNQGGFSYYCIFCFPHCEPRRIFILLYILLSSLWTPRRIFILLYIQWGKQNIQ